MVKLTVVQLFLVALLVLLLVFVVGGCRVNCKMNEPYNDNGRLQDQHTDPNQVDRAYCPCPQQFPQPKSDPLNRLLASQPLSTNLVSSSNGTTNGTTKEGFCGSCGALALALA